MSQNWNVKVMRGMSHFTLIKSAWIRNEVHLPTRWKKISFEIIALIYFDNRAVCFQFALFLEFIFKSPRNQG